MWVNNDDAPNQPNDIQLYVVATPDEGSVMDETKL